MTDAIINEVKAKALELFAKAGLFLSEENKESLVVTDFGLGDIYAEGAQYITLFNGPKISGKYIALLPGQTYPEHRHPIVDGKPGKAKTLHCAFGEFYLYHNYFWRAPKPETPAAKLPEANKEYYACVYESIIKAGSNYHMGADDLHWFQAGPEGAVIIEFGTYSNDDKDYYTNYHAAPLENKEFKVLP
ncbi:MAG: D-lyxose/D-mannose family sugar isomerase [Clostridiales bacterium]|nr:D-lyxose/D-mannose family sugar isomerase [Clostridiales bacterium]